MKASDNLFPGIILNEAANDGSDFTNPSADYRRLFLGEDGNLHLKDSSGNVTDVASAAGAPTTTPYVTTAIDANLSAEVVIPGLAGSPDIRVAGADDDEFDSTDTSDPMTGWTTLGTPTAHDINSTAKSHYYISKSATAGPAQHGIYKAKSPAFTMTAKLADLTLNGNDNSAGIFVGEATPGKMLIAGLYFNSGVDPRRQILCQIWTNPTTYSSTVATIQGSHEAPIYLRVVATSSTNVSTYYSVNGFAWRLIASATNPSMTVASAGLFMLQNNATYDMAAYFDWVRFT